MKKENFNQRATHPGAADFLSYYRACVNNETKGIEKFLNKWGDEYVDAQVSIKSGKISFNAAKHTGLVLAAMYGAVDSIQELGRHNAQVNKRGPEKDPEKDKESWTALWWAFESRHFKAVDALIDLGADVNTKGIGAQTLLMAAMDLPYSLGDNNPEAAQAAACVQGAKMVLAAGVDIDAVDNRGRTARDIALEKGRGDLVKLIDAEVAHRAAVKPSAKNLPQDKNNAAPR